MIDRLASMAYTLRRTIMVAWVVLVLSTVAALAVFSPALDGPLVNAPGSESAKVQEMLRPLHAGGVFVIGVVEASPDDEMALQEARDAVVDILEMDGVFASYSYGDTPLEMLLADNEQTFLILTVMDGTATPDEVAEFSGPVVERLGEVNGGDILVGGDAFIASELVKFAEADALRAEVIGAPIALLVLILVLGGVRVGLLPIATAATGILTAIFALHTWEMFTSLTVFAMNIISLFGIALGVDYGLLIVARYREELAAGRDPETAVRFTILTAGRTVLFSAFTVAISMAGLLFLGDPQSRSLAAAGITVSLTVALVSVLFLPAALGALSKHVKPKAAAGESGRFGQVAKAVQTRPGIVAIAVVIFFVALASPVLGMKTSLVDERFLPDQSGMKQAALVLESDYSQISTQPVMVVVDAFDDDERVAGFIEEIAAKEQVRSASIRPNLNGSKIPVVIEVVTDEHSQSDSGRALVEELRGMDPGFSFDVGGRAAALVDTSELISGRVLPAALWVLVATFVLLFLMTGSVFIPFKAIAMNVLVLTATFGIIVWVFQDGNLSSFFGFTAPGYVDIYTPFQVMAFAFGLSMDYEIFLISRIKEFYDRHGDNRRAVAEAIQTTGSIITSAALLICVVFGSAMLGDLITLKQLALALFIAVAFDSTIIRTLMVPATMTMMGDLNWWAPAPLRRLHDRFGITEVIDVEALDQVHHVPAVPSPQPELTAATASNSDDPGAALPAPPTSPAAVLPQPPADTTEALANAVDELDWDWAAAEELYDLSDWAPEPEEAELIDWFRSGAEGPNTAAATEATLEPTEKDQPDLDDLSELDELGEPDDPGVEPDGLDELDTHVAPVKLTPVPDITGPDGAGHDLTNELSEFDVRTKNGVADRAGLDEVRFEFDPDLGGRLGDGTSIRFADLVDRLTTIHAEDELVLRIRRPIPGSNIREVFLVIPAGTRRIGFIVDPAPAPAPA